MKKTLMLIVAATALITSSSAQEQPSKATGQSASNGASVAQDKGTAQTPATGQSASAEQNPTADTPGEKNLPDSVDIIGVPKANPNKDSATITWETNKVAATDVWLEGGDINGHRVGSEKGGSKTHSVTFSNLKPNTAYNYKIRSSHGEVRYEGKFTTKG